MDSRSFGSKACTALLKTLLIVFNALFLMLGVLLFTIGIYGLSVTNVLFITFASQRTIYLPFLLIGLFMMIVGSLSLWCTPKGITWLLYLYGCIIFILFAAVFILSALLIVRHDAVENSLKVGITKSMENYSNDKIAMDRLQSTLRCCGSSNFSDWFSTKWFNETRSIPASCCINSTMCHNTQNIETQDLFDRGCFQLLGNSIQQYYSTMGGIGFASSILIFFGSVLACSLARNIKQSRYEQLQ